MSRQNQKRRCPAGRIRGCFAGRPLYEPVPDDADIQMRNLPFYAVCGKRRRRNDRSRPASRRTARAMRASLPPPVSGQAKCTACRPARPRTSRRTRLSSRFSGRYTQSPSRSPHRGYPVSRPPRKSRRLASGGRYGQCRLFFFEDAFGKSAVLAVVETHSEV